MTALVAALLVSQARAEDPDEARADRHWAFQPLAATEWTPDADAAHPIDRFIRARQEERGTEAVGLADRRTLLRRAAFDLTGLPPSDGDLALFLGDREPRAFERAVDRLLASPRYGERWGRHWLDLVRYADTAGDDSDYPIPQARLYRDYVIDSFNADKPYDLFLREQIAGDLMAREGPAELYRERVIATGFLAQAKRFATHKHEDMHLIIEDTVHTLGETVLGLTIGCARCHDHKYEPITTDDYYALYGFFQGTVYPHPGSEEERRPSDLVPLVPDAELARREAEFRARHGERIEALEAAIKAIEERTEDKTEREKATAAPHAELEKLLARHPRRDVPVAYAVKDGQPSEAHVQIGGDPHRKGVLVSRGVPRCLGGGASFEIRAEESGRLELARWLTAPAKPLTARVMVNRIWQHHFGRGLVRTPSDFGLQGAPPTHPRLLDWLAKRFIASGWSIKAMHRLILSSETWQRSSAGGERNEGIDPANETYWRFQRRRLEAEAIRDTLLLLGGSLDLSRPGPHPFPPVDGWRYSAHHQFKAVYPSSYRSVYLMVQRLHPHPFLSLFNGPDTTASTPVRDSSTLPLQALFLRNGGLVHEQATRLAIALVDALPDRFPRVKRLYERCFSRPATEDELRRAIGYLDGYEKELVGEGVEDGERELAALASFVRVLFASNEFVYVD